jgi:hypothetical protein
VVIGKFGAKTFEVSPQKILTPKDFSLSGDLATSSEDAAKKKPATTINGPGLIKISAEVQLLASAGIDVRAEIDSWFALKDASVAYPFILCGKAVSLNSFLLTSCDTSDFVISKAASAPYIASATLKLEWQEYLPPGAQSSAKKKTGSAVGLTVTNVSSPYKVPTAAQKATEKRVNERMSGP